VEQKKVLATPVRRLIPRLATTTERLHAENTILKTRLQAATNVLASRKEQKKGARVSLKDHLLLTADEAIAAAKHAKEEKKKRGKKGGTQGKRRKLRVSRRMIQAKWIAILYSHRRFLIVLWWNSVSNSI
jgi:hypothetical protein